MQIFIREESQKRIIHSVHQTKIIQVNFLLYSFNKRGFHHIAIVCLPIAVPLFNMKSYFLLLDNGLVVRKYTDIKLLYLVRLKEDGRLTRYRTITQSHSIIKTHSDSAVLLVELCK